jgi:hypothetical protein
MTKPAIANDWSSCRRRAALTLSGLTVHQARRTHGAL